MHANKSNESLAYLSKSMPQVTVIYDSCQNGGHGRVPNPPRIFQGNSPQMGNQVLTVFISTACRSPNPSRFFQNGKAAFNSHGQEPFKPQRA
jgi:hypothetical protein